MNGCRIPPEGWMCSREQGHDGPCAASVDFPEAKFLKLPLRPREIITSLVRLGDSLYVCTDERVFELRQKVPWYNKLWRKICGWF
jgi:hypothetical protein